MIFTVFALAKQAMLRRLEKDTSICILVISPLTSIAADQIAQMESFGFNAVELTELTLTDVIHSPPNFIYSSAERATERAFLEALKDDCSLLHQRTASIVVDESHTVETWTGKRKNKCKKANMNKAFRSAFGKLSLLRSMCKKDCPLLALTGTGDKSTQDTICNELLLKEPTKLFVSPNRPNLRFSVHKVKKDDMLAQLNWLISLIEEYGINTPKTIIFCDTMYTIASVCQLFDDAIGV
ncbi:Hypothetical predicted protein [Paramuricea clavata]|uniref:DNA 3'-5' helicase n=1 Tax=Paramuricea clavata TaxID=317549 RepID=A0A6S7GZV0_PARCT|nr:Hypothetical predicted protein [Paramuricea clavata]